MSRPAIFGRAKRAGGRDSDRSLRPDRFVLIARIVLALAMLAAAVITAREWHIAHMAKLARSARDQPTESRRRELADRLSGCATANSERVLSACITGFAALTEQAASPEEASSYIAAALRADTRLQGRAPDNGEARILHALAAANARDMEEAVAALGQSYAMQRFSPFAGMWRIWWGTHHWSQIDPALRIAVDQEALWYASQGQSQREDVINAVADTPAYTAIALRLPGRGLANRPFGSAPE